MVDGPNAPLLQVDPCYDVSIAETSVSNDFQVEVQRFRRV
jgi:hypothetical protein